MKFLFGILFFFFFSHKCCFLSSHNFSQIKLDKSIVSQILKINLELDKSIVSQILKINLESVLVLEIYLKGYNFIFS